MHKSDYVLFNIHHFTKFMSRSSYLCRPKQAYFIVNYILIVNEITLQHPSEMATRLFLTRWHFII